MTPFIKWAGGKHSLLPQLKQFVPEQFEHYVEPFVGGGAMLLHLLATRKHIKHAYILDVNSQLLNVYKTVKHRPAALTAELNRLISEYDASADRQAFYYLQRSIYNSKLLGQNSAVGNVSTAAQFIFLNKTCFNGLYRVNKQGLFNVPWGKRAMQPIDNLVAYSNLLQKVSIFNGDYANCISFCQAGNTFAYMDPPYLPISATSNFTGYTANGFNIAEHAVLADFCKLLDVSNIKFMLSNADAPVVHELYSGFNIHKVQANRRIASKAKSRGTVAELVITNY